MSQESRASEARYHAVTKALHWLVALLAAALILIQHRGNMGRLLSGVEPRFRAGHGVR